MRFRFIAGAVTMAALAAALAVPAAASAATSCSGGACTQAGSLTVTATITLTETPATFSDGSITAGSSSPAPSGSMAAQWVANVVTGDANGYSLTSIAGTDWTSGAFTFPASDTTLYGAAPGTTNCWSNTCSITSNPPAPVALPEPSGTPVTDYTTTAASAPSGDNFGFFTSTAVPASQRTGAYTLNLNQLAIGS
jgi:hypothetical protein